MTVTPLGKTMTNSQLFKKWSRWLERIEKDLIDLTVQHRHFHELVAATDPYMGMARGAEVARWMAQGYYAYASMAVRRLVEGKSQKPSPKKRDPRLIISLVVLLEDLLANNSVLTRNRTRTIYRRAMGHLPERIYVSAADSAFDLSTDTKNKAVLPVSKIEHDIKSLKAASKRVKRHVDKVYAHTERDRRRIGKPLQAVEIDGAIKTILKIYHRYALLIQGRDRHDLVPQDFFEIAMDLKRIWPDPPVPDLTLNEEDFA
jgi:HEPN superfamily AbiU2-like protein